MSYTCEFPHKHSVFTGPDEHMPYIIQFHIMSIQPANKTVEHLIIECFDTKDEDADVHDDDGGDE